VLLFVVVVLSVVVLTTGAGTMLRVVVVVCDCSDACGAGLTGTETEHPAALRLPTRKASATYSEALVLFFITSI
jgi:hypothetical protein